MLFTVVVKESNCENVLLHTVMVLVKVLYLLVSHNLTVASYEPEANSNSLLGDQANDDTHPLCEVSVPLMIWPSVIEYKELLYSNIVKIQYV